MSEEQKPYDFSRYLVPWEKEQFLKSVPEEVYHAEPAMSAGQVKKILSREGGIHLLHAEKNLVTTPKDSPALRFGTIFHKACLEGP